MVKKSTKVSVFWFRRDLRLNDNRGLCEALTDAYPVLPLFIFDSLILEQLSDPRDRRVEFIHKALLEMQQQLRQSGSSLIVYHGEPLVIWRRLLEEFDIAAVYTNHDYEPYARERDARVHEMLASRGIPFRTFKDQVIFEKEEVLNNQGKPFKVYTPYRNKWRSLLRGGQLKPCPSENMPDHFLKTAPVNIPALKEIGFQATGAQFPAKDTRESLIRNYHRRRDFPGIDGTSRLSVHLRFGTVSIRRVVETALKLNETWLDELVWREFFMMILWHFPGVVDQPFKEKYRAIPWRNDRQEFERWCRGNTGYPIVDAGMRELNETGFMHNRLRMITAGFLTRHLLIDWRRGERYFAEKLLDYELSSNNGNWQWAAGCGCDAAPYFRIFNPHTQTKKFDPDLAYIKKWVPELNTRDYPPPIVEHKYARQRALAVFRSVLAS